MTHETEKTFTLELTGWQAKRLYELAEAPGLDGQIKTFLLLIRGGIQPTGGSGFKFAFLKAMEPD